MLSLDGKIILVWSFEGGEETKPMNVDGSLTAFHKAWGCSIARLCQVFVHVVLFHRYLFRVRTKIAVPQNFALCFLYWCNSFDKATLCATLELLYCL